MTVGIFSFFLFFFLLFSSPPPSSRIMEGQGLASVSDTVPSPPLKVVQVLLIRDVKADYLKISKLLKGIVSMNERCCSNPPTHCPPPPSIAIGFTS